MGKTKAKVNTKTKAKTQTKDNKKASIANVPIYKTWWFWALIVLLFAGCVYSASGGKSGSGDTGSSSGSSSSYTDSGSNSSSSNNKSQSAPDYTGKDAKKAYDELISQGYSVKFVFDRTNNGGFSDSVFQDFVINDSFKSGHYDEMPFTVTRQDSGSKAVVLYIEYSDVYAENNAQAAREQRLEGRLSIVSAMTACEQYGKSHYRNFKMHSIIGRIAEYASDDNTWFLKYYVDYDGYKNKTMECYVTGTTNNPSVAKFLAY